MADTDTTKADETKTDQTPENPIVKAIGDLREDVKSFKDETKTEVDELKKSIDEAKKVQYPHGAPTGQLWRGGIAKGESANSRPYSLMTFAKRLAMQSANQPGWQDVGKQEADLSDRLNKAHFGSFGFREGSVSVPLGADLMPVDETAYDVGEKEKVIVKGMDRTLVEECRQVMNWDHAADPDELAWLGKRFDILKDLSGQIATTGGTLVGNATQGELIGLLTAREFFSQVGAQSIEFPPQGKIRFPRETGGLTIAATSEGATISESTPATGSLELHAKPYTGLVDIPEELMKFATSVSAEAWLRSAFARDVGLQTDSDMFNGAGGIAILGVVNYSGFRTVLASTIAAQGDTLEPQDPKRLFGDIADQNAPVDEGFFYGMTATKWSGLSGKRADAVSAADEAGPFVFSTATQSLGGGRTAKTLDGYPAICSTQVPTNRAKGAATDLTMLIGGVGREWVIARAGVLDIVVTNSDASKFQQRLSTMRGTQYIDAGPKHENSFGMIDDILNS